MKITITSPGKQVQIEGKENLNDMAIKAVYVFNHSILPEDMGYLEGEEEEFQQHDGNLDAALKVVYLGLKKNDLEQAVEEYRENPKTWPEGLYIEWDGYWGKIVKNAPNEPDLMTVRMGVTGDTTDISISEKSPTIMTYKDMLTYGSKDLFTFEAYCNWNGIKTF